MFGGMDGSPGLPRGDAGLGDAGLGDDGVRPAARRVGGRSGHWNDSTLFGGGA